MRYGTRDIQARCWAYGINAGPIDGLWGKKTQEGTRKLMELKGVSTIEDCFHRSGLHRIHMHWTAGAYGVTQYELSHYHVVVDNEGSAYTGVLKPEANANSSDGQYVAHTRMANSGAIGVAVDCMAGAIERPFDAGQYPMTRVQLRAMAQQVADLCDTYDIPVSRYSTLTHSEIQPTLGIRQRAKWDINWIPGMKNPSDPIVVGDAIRELIIQET